MKVVVDIYGGDNAPKEIVKGCVQALKENRGFDLVLVGKANEIADLLKEQTVEMSRVENSGRARRDNQRRRAHHRRLEPKKKARSLWLLTE